MPPHVLSDFVVSLPRLWLKCNRLLKLGRPVGAVTLSRWNERWNERWIWVARGALNLISTNYPDHGHHGRLPLSRKNAYGRAGNRTRDLIVSSQELLPPSHEAGRRFFVLRIRNYAFLTNSTALYHKKQSLLSLQWRTRMSEIVRENSDRGKNSSFSLCTLVTDSRDPSFWICVP